MSGAKCRPLNAKLMPHAPDRSRLRHGGSHPQSLFATDPRDVANEEASVAENEVKALDQLKHIDVRAPIAGTVHKLAIHTVGGVIRPAKTLMEIVPREAD